MQKKKEEKKQQPILLHRCCVSVDVCVRVFQWKPHISGAQKVVFSYFLGQSYIIRMNSPLSLSSRSFLYSPLCLFCFQLLCLVLIFYIPLCFILHFAIHGSFVNFFCLVADVLWVCCFFPPRILLFFFNSLCSLHNKKKFWIASCSSFINYWRLSKQEDSKRPVS